MCEGSRVAVEQANERTRNVMERGFAVKQYNKPGRPLLLLLLLVVGSMKKSWLPVALYYYDVFLGCCCC